jgi:hypothetical protein
LENNNCRVKLLRISADFLFSLFANGPHSVPYEVRHGIPEDAVITGVIQDYMVPGTINLVIHHPTFDPVREGEMIPELRPEITVVH